MNSLLFLIQEAWHNIRRNGLMTFAALGTVTVALTVLGATLWTAFRLSEFTRQQPQKFNQIAVFLSPDAEREDAEKLESRIRVVPEVARVHLVTKEEAWLNLQRDESVLTDALDGNPLPDKLEVDVRDATQVSATARLLRNTALFPEADKVIDSGDAVKTLLGISRLVKVIGGGAAIGLFVATLFIVHNTIRLTVFARRREIRIMQLVGATPAFNRLPLLLEGLFHGVVGGALAAGILLACGREVSRFVSGLRSPLIGEIPAYFAPAQIAGLVVLMGAFIGLLGSLLAIRRFLKQI
jgi:cell division transport system permease protein